MGFNQVFYASTATALYATAGYKRIGFVWGGSGRAYLYSDGNGDIRSNLYDTQEPVINVGGYVSTGSVFTTYQLDSQDGSTLFAPTSSAISGIHISADTMYTVDPGTGRLWTYGLWVKVSGAASGTRSVVMDTLRSSGAFPNAYSSTTDDSLRWDTYIAGTIEDFAIDRNANRLWIRMASMNTGAVGMYNFTTHDLIATLYASNTTKGIIPTGDGYVFIVDAYQWVHLYDYDGGYWGSARNPFTEGTGGSVYGWDANYKRLLCIPGITQNIVGYKWAPNAVRLSTPIPRVVPRKNQITYFFSNLMGDGGEGISSRFAALTNEGLAIGERISDKDGDIIERITPADTANQDVTLSVPASTRINNRSQGVVLPTGTVYVQSTDGFTDSGVFVVIADGDYGSPTVTYTGRTTNSFTGCSGGSVTLVTGYEVVQ